MVLSVHSFFPSVGLRMLGGGGNLGDPAIATDEGGEIGTGGGGGSAEETAKLLPQQPQPTSGGWGWPSFGGMMGSSNNTSPSQREGMRLLYQYFRLVIFLLHAATSVFFLVAAFTTNCGPSLVTASYFESVAILDGAWGGYNFDSHAGPSLPSMATLAMGASGLPPATLPAGPDPPVYNVEFLNANGSLYQSACVYPMLAGNNYASWSGVQYYSENRSWYICRALNPGPPYIMDVQEDVRSFIVGSAWNVLVLVLIFEWITSSYALLYLQEPAVLLQYLPVPPGFHPVPTLATVWNLAMIVILWAWRDRLLLPDNNLLLYSVLLLTTVVLQNYLARPGVPPLLAVGGAVVEEEDAAEEGRGATVKEGFRASGHKTRSLMRTDALASSSSSSTYPLYQRKGKGGNNSSMRQLKGLGGGAHEFNTAAFLGGLTSGAVSSSTALTANETTGGKQAPLPAYVRWPVFYGSPSAGAVHSPVYAYNLDEGGEAVAARMMEYSTTAPLLLVGLTLCYMGAALTWAYQVLFLALMMCNALGIVLHYVVLLLRTAADEADRARLRDAGLLLLLASWLSFAAGFAIYLNEAADFMIHGTDMSGVPVWVVMLTWSLTIMYAAFGVVVTWFYLPRLMYPDPASWTATKAGDGAKDPWMRSFDWVVFSLDILSVAAKLALAWTIYTKGSVVNCAVVAAGSGGGGGC